MPDRKSEVGATVFAEQREVELVESDRIYPWNLPITPGWRARRDALDGETVSSPISAELPDVDHHSRASERTRLGWRPKPVRIHPSSLDPAVAGRFHLRACFS